jgi:RNA-directed DNA polymerase
VRSPSATRLVICCKGNAEQAMTEMRRLMEQLKLTVNEAKTHIRELPQERFDFLGYSFGRYYSPGGLIFARNRQRRACSA